MRSQEQGDPAGPGADVFLSPQILSGFEFGLSSVRKQRISDSCNDTFNKCKISVSFPALNRHLETNFSQARVGKHLFKETGNIKVYFLNDNVFMIAAITLQPKGQFEFKSCF